MSTICRTCMSKEKDMISIFNQGKSPSITDMIMAISAVKFSPTDTLPPQMCTTCCETLEIAYYFKNQIIRINDALHEQAQTSKLLAPQANEEMDEIEENEDVYKDQIEISAENITFNADPPCKCPQNSLTSLGTSNPSTENDIKSFNHELSLNGKAQNNVDVHFDEICIKTEETNENSEQSEDNCQIIPQQIIIKMQTDDNEFYSEDDLPLSSLHVGTKSYNKSKDIQQNSNKNGEASRKPAICNIPYQRTFCSTFTSHVNEHKRRNKCEDCERTFTGRQNLISHMRMHSRETPFKCQNCHASFKHTSSLRNHIRLHTGETRPKPYKCEDCGKTYGKPCLLKEHMRTHTGEKPFQCQLCNVRFRHSASLRNHMRLHADEAAPKPYMCEICGNSFCSPSNLTEHIRSHTGEKPFECQFCKASFSQRGSLNKHIRLHTGEAKPKPHKCDVCGKTFTSPWYLKQHMLCHTDDKPFRCLDCNAGFKRLDNLNRHIRLHTGETTSYLKTLEVQTLQGDVKKLTTGANVKQRTFSRNLN